MVRMLEIINTESSGHRPFAHDVHFFHGSQNANRERRGEKKEKDTSWLLFLPSAV